MSHTLGRLLAGRYELADRIATGGMAEIFEATDTRLDRPVAVKVLREPIVDRPGARERMLVEARLAAQLDHPNVVAVLDGGVEDGHPFLVMERLHGSTLRDHLAQRVRLDPEVAADIARQVLGALAAAHRLGIVHRDIKPANILRAPAGVWKVADFGIATSLDADTITKTGEILGSPAYLAPERLAGRRATPSTDIYGVGVVLYEALAGRRAFEGDDALQVAAAIRTGRRAPLGELRPGLPAGLVAAVERAMSIEPNDRFASADEFAAAIGVTTEKSSATTTVAVPPPEATRPLPAPLRTAASRVAAIPPRPDRRSRMPLVGWLVVLATVLVFGSATVLLVDATGSTPSLAHSPAAVSPSARPPVSAGATGPAPAGPGVQLGNAHDENKPGKGPKH